MAGEKSINPKVAEQVQVVLNRIAEIASTIHDLAVEQVDDGAEDVSFSKAVAIRELASQAGLIADIAAGKLSGSTGGFRGGAEEWLMPPIYQDLAKEVTAGRQGAQHG